MQKRNRQQSGRAERDDQREKLPLANAVLAAFEMLAQQVLPDRHRLPENDLIAIRQARTAVECLDTRR